MCFNGKFNWRCPDCRDSMKYFIYDRFEYVCAHGSEQEIEDMIKGLGIIDLNADDGYYLETICMRNDLNLLKMILRNGADIHMNNEGILRLVAHAGYDELVRYLLYNCNVNHRVLYETTAGSNKRSIIKILEEYEEYLSNLNAL